MQLIECIKESKGLSYADIALKLRIKYRTLINYNNFDREMPLYLVVKIVHLYDLSWRKVGKLLARDYTQYRLKRLDSPDAVGKFRQIMSCRSTSL